jgi:hypothetical protein
VQQLQAACQEAEAVKAHWQALVLEQQQQVAGKGTQVQVQALRAGGMAMRELLGGVAEEQRSLLASLQESQDLVERLRELREQVGGPASIASCLGFVMALERC